jgi:hypothetical protein
MNSTPKSFASNIWRIYDEEYDGSRLRQKVKSFVHDRPRKPEEV